MPPAPRLRPAPEARSDKSAPAGPASGPRKPAGKELLHADGKGTQIFSKRGRPAAGRKLSEVIESTTLFWGLTRDPEVRAKVRSQVRRLRRDAKRRYDPRLVAGIIAKRVHIPEIAVHEILQGSVPEFEEWMAEIRSGCSRLLAAADEKAAATWLKRTA